MRTLNAILSLTLSLLLSGLLIPSAAAEGQTRSAGSDPSLVTEAEIDGALRSAVEEEEASRDAIRHFLAREDVRRLAADLGITSVTLERASEAVGTLEGPELDAVAAHAAQLSDELAGGITVTISLVALLLIVIIIILLVG